jgi:hypothetical protein
MTTEAGKKTILVFLAIMFFALIFLFSIDQVKPTYIANKEIAVTVTNNYSLTYQEYKLQAGEAYRSIDDIILASGDTVYIGALTSDKTICMYERQLHGVSAQEIEIDVNLYEGGEFIGGTVLTNYNRNRNFDDNSTFEIYTDVAVITLGDLLPYPTFLYGEKNIKIGSSEKVSCVMRKNTTYIIKIDNLGIKSNDLDFIWNWLENECNN